MLFKTVKSLPDDHPVNICPHNLNYETSVWTPSRAQFPRDINARFKCNTCGLEVTARDSDDPEINALFMHASGGTT